MRLPTLAREKRQARAERQTASTEDNTTTGAAAIDERGAGTCNDSSLELIQIMPLIVHDLASFFKCFDKQETRWLVVSPVGFLGKDRDHASEHEHPHR